MASDSKNKEIEADFSPYLKAFKDGTVERMFGSPFVPPSLEDPITNVSSKDITISPNVSARIYLPKITDPCEKLPVLVYYHGGGFCLGSAFSLLDHRYLNQLASKARAVAVSVEYRLAPEHPLPAAFEDSWEALQWVASHSEIDGGKEPWLINHGEFERVYVGGDSAGGNIAYNMAVKAGVERLIGGVKILGAILSFTYFCDSKTKKGSDEESLGYRMWMFLNPSDPGGINNPLINPFSGEAPELSKIRCRKVFVCCAEKDDLREINLRYAAALKKSGFEGEVEVVDVEGEDHCFQAFDPSTEKAQSLISRMASFISG